MTNAELIAKIKAEIERRIALYSSLSENTVNPNRIDEDRQILSFLSTLESGKPMQDGLEDEIERYIPTSLAVKFPTTDIETIKSDIRYIARHFAKWGADHTPLPEDTVLFNKGVEEGKRLMMEEFEGNRLAACDSQTKEEYDRETDFVDGIIKKEHRQPTFSDAINYGMRLQKEQMMKEAVEGYIERDLGGQLILGRKNAPAGDEFMLLESTLFPEIHTGDHSSVRIIIVKED